VLLRATATAFVGVLIGLWCKDFGLSDTQVDLVLAAGLWGAAVACLLVTWRGDDFGRRRTMVALALCASAGALGFGWARDPLLLAGVAFLGMLNSVGRDRGATLILEQASLPATTDTAGRTRTFAIYNLLQDSGHALGALLASVPMLAGGGGSSGHAGPILLAVLFLVPALIAARLSPLVEAPPERKTMARLSPGSRRTILRLSSLILVDATGGGFLSTALLAWFFYVRFGLDRTQLGLLFTARSVLNAISHLGAAWLAKRIGLVRTMVLTHLPSSVLLLLVPWAPSFPIAVALFLLREGLVEMDVPARQSYVMAIVAPHERTTAAGITGLVRMAGWGLAPLLIAAVGMNQPDRVAPLVIGCTLKISYDVLLWRAFRHQHPPEEAAAA
jgi:MFS family permease